MSGGPLRGEAAGGHHSVLRSEKLSAGRDLGGGHMPSLGWEGGTAPSTGWVQVTKAQGFTHPVRVLQHLWGIFFFKPDHFTEEDVLVADTHTRECSSPLAIGEKPTKTIGR